MIEEPGQIGQSTRTSPGGSPADSDAGEPVEREKTESMRNASLHRKMLETHLHVPSIRHVSGSRSGSVRRMVAGSTSTPGTSLYIQSVSVDANLDRPVSTARSNLLNRIDCNTFTRPYPGLVPFPCPLSTP